MTVYGWPMERLPRYNAASLVPFVSIRKRHRFDVSPRRHRHYAPWCNLFNPTVKPSLRSPLVSRSVCQQFHSVVPSHGMVALIKPNSQEIMRPRACILHTHLRHNDSQFGYSSERPWLPIATKVQLERYETSTMIISF